MSEPASAPSHLSVLTPLGMVTLFADGDALIALEWGQAPRAEGAPEAVLLAARDQLARYFDGRLKRFDLALAAAGTPFQRRAWAALSAIGYGKTVTYGALAATLGSGPRAIALACARNPLPIIVPCHRVVGASGLGGYSGGDGLSTKRQLLTLEGVRVPETAA
jgi:methylated-DNA-[protein]-cysteine S-methyltransferase